MSQASLYVSVSPFETRVALREDGRLVVYRVERAHSSSAVGNLYKGRVTRVLPGMQAAFVDIGLERDAFLYVREAGGILDDFSELFPVTGDGPPTPEVGSAAIGDLLREGQEVLVQVVKDELGGKGARLTTYLAFPGRFLVHLPTVRQTGVSRRIADETERTRLRTLAEGFGGGGWIVRTAAEGRAASVLEADRAYLERLWRRVQTTAERSGAPVLLHHELDPVLRTVRDMLGSGVDECWLDDPQAFREVTDFVGELEPSLVPRLRLFTRADDLMTAFEVERELEKALRPRVWLRSGGYLVVNETEALVAIDVNTGKYVGSTSLEDTVFRTNLEAVGEIVRQLRLRDLGGIIVIDFIDMEDSEHRRRVYDALAEELERDPARSQLLPMSDIGLIQLTRKRTRPSLDRVLNRECPHCGGAGRIKSLTTVCMELRRAVLEQAASGAAEMVVEVHPEVAAHLNGPMRAVLSELADAHGVRLQLRPNVQLHHARFVIRG